MATRLRTRLARGLGAAAALALLAALAPATAYPADPPADALKYLPDGADFVVSVKVGELLDSGVWKEVRKEVKDFDKMTKDFKDMTTLDPADIDRVTLAGKMGKGSEDAAPLVAARTRRAVKAADLAAFQKNKQFKETKVAGQTVYEDGKDGTAFAVIGGNMVLAGPGKQLRAVLERRGQAKLSDAMRASLRQADFSQTVAFAADVHLFHIEDKKGSGVEQRFLEPLVGVAGSARVGNDLDVKLTVLCKDAETADDARKLADAGLVLLKYFARDQKDFPKEGLDLIKKVKVSAEGTNVSATVTVPGPVLAKAVKALSDKK